MRIGILTYHKSHNFGALLQALALRKVLSDMGGDVTFVDYWPDYQKKMYNLFDWSVLKECSLLGKIKVTLIYLAFSPLKYLRRSKFIKFIRHNIEPFCRPTQNQLDMLVCGSDQIWRKQPRLGDRFNPIYFGAGVTNASQYISYAASMGTVDVSSRDIVQLQSLLANLKAISVRENQLNKLLSEIGVKDVVTVLDPTLLLTRSQWKSLAGISDDEKDERYVLVYELKREKTFDRQAINDYARRHNLSVKILRGTVGMESLERNAISVADPFDMVRLVAGAHSVFTSSYHGLVFSIIFGRQVVASFLNDSSRAYNLLESIGYSERLIPPGSRNFEFKEIDFQKVDQRLGVMRESSLNWLKNALK